MQDFTKDIWTFDDTNGVISSGDELIAQVFGATIHNHEDNREKCFAYARLIANAPKLFKLLDKVRNLEDDIWTLLENILGEDEEYD